MGFGLFDLETIDPVGIKRDVVNETKPAIITILSHNSEAIVGFVDSEMMPVGVLIEAVELHIVQLVEHSY